MKRGMKSISIFIVMRFLTVAFDPVVCFAPFSKLHQTQSQKSALQLTTNPDNQKKDNIIESRREILTTLATSVLYGSTVLLPQPANADILRTQGTCASGVGEGCDGLAGENEFIKELQRRSAEKKEIMSKEYLGAYQNKNYPDFFASLNPPKYMVFKKSDGTYQLYDDAQLAELKRSGKVRPEQPKTMGGKLTDLTQKPVLVLVE